MANITKVSFENLKAENVFDHNKKCRYSTVRIWDDQKDKATIIMYNPKTISPNPFLLGQSLSKCVSKVIEDSQGTIGGIEVVNLFARISDSKQELEKPFKIFDEENFKYIKKAVDGSSVVVLAWGKTGRVVTKNNKFIDLFSSYTGSLKCFDLHDNHQPIYPRHLSLEAQLRNCYMDCYGNIHFIEG
jgi:hypothetical protein